MLGKGWTGSFCRYFRENVLPLAPVLERPSVRKGRRRSRERMRKKRSTPGQERYDLDLPKARDSKGS